MAALARGAAMKGGGDKNKKVAAGGRLLSVVAVGCFLLFVVVVFTLSSRRYATLVLDARDRECASAFSICFRSERPTYCRARVRVYLHRYAIYDFLGIISSCMHSALNHRSVN